MTSGRGLPLGNPSAFRRWAAVFCGLAVVIAPAALRGQVPKSSPRPGPGPEILRIPRLLAAPKIDGDLADWREAPKAPADRDRECGRVPAELTEAKSPIDRKSK